MTGGTGGWNGSGWPGELGSGEGTGASPGSCVGSAGPVGFVGSGDPGNGLGSPGK